MDQFELLLMQTGLDESRMLETKVSRDKVRVSGNIKFDQKWEPLDNQELQRWRELLGVEEGPIWVAGSTHDPEETIIFNVFEKLIEVFTNLSLGLGKLHPMPGSAASMQLEEPICHHKVKHTTFSSSIPLEN